MRNGLAALSLVGLLCILTAGCETVGADDEAPTNQAESFSLDSLNVVITHEATILDEPDTTEISRLFEITNVSGAKVNNIALVVRLYGIELPASGPCSYCGKMLDSERFDVESLLPEEKAESRDFFEIVNAEVEKPLSGGDTCYRYKLEATLESGETKSKLDGASCEWKRENTEDF